jgi:hypothetical protein
MTKNIVSKDSRERSLGKLIESKFVNTTNVYNSKSGVKVNLLGWVRAGQGRTGSVIRQLTEEEG